MSRSLSIPDELYNRLAAEASAEGLSGIEALLHRISNAFSKDQKRKEQELEATVDRVARLVRKSEVRIVAAEPRRPVPKFGSARGLIKIADDFDAPLEDFEAYGP